MPLGHKCNPYVTLRDAGHDPIEFRRIARIMTARGSKMNHATARGVLLNAMRKFAAALSDDPDVIERLIHSNTFQSLVGDIVQHCNNNMNT